MTSSTQRTSLSKRNLILLILLLRGTDGYAQNTNLQIQKLMRSLGGTWSITEYQPDKTSNVDVGHGTETWRPGPEGLSIVEEFHATGVAGEVLGTAVLWWDETEQGFRTLWCVNTNPKGCTLLTDVAKWEGRQFVFRDESGSSGDTKKARFKEVFSEITPTSFTQTSYEGEANGELRPFSTIQATRLKKPQH